MGHSNVGSQLSINFRLSTLTKWTILKALESWVMLDLLICTWNLTQIMKLIKKFILNLLKSIKDSEHALQQPSNSCIGVLTERLDRILLRLQVLSEYKIKNISDHWLWSNYRIWKIERKICWNCSFLLESIWRTVDIKQYWYRNLYQTRWTWCKPSNNSLRTLVLAFKQNDSIRYH